jgi:hypothetical protein
VIVTMSSDSGTLRAAIGFTLTETNTLVRFAHTYLNAVRVNATEFRYFGNSLTPSVPFNL